VELTVRGLCRRHHAVAVKKLQSTLYRPLQKFAEEWHVRHWSELLYVTAVQVSFLQQRPNNGILKLRREAARGQRNVEQHGKEW